MTSGVCATIRFLGLLVPLAGCATNRSMAGPSASRRTVAHDTVLKNRDFAAIFGRGVRDSKTQDSTTLTWRRDGLFCLLALCRNAQKERALSSPFLSAPQGCAVELATGWQR
jgi:hypothetical protein